MKNKLKSLISKAKLKLWFLSFRGYRSFVVRFNIENEIDTELAFLVTIDPLTQKVKVIPRADNEQSKTCTIIS